MKRLKMLKVSVEHPTLVKIPAPGEEADLERVSGRIRITWPHNWSELPPLWKAVLLRELTLMLVHNVLRGSPDREATIEELKAQNVFGPPPPEPKKKEKKT